MNDFIAVQEFFCRLHCSMCHSYFKPEGITLIKKEDNFFVVKVDCVLCNQPVGIAIVSISSLDEADVLKNAEQSNVDSEKHIERPSITYDDVIEAHKFFSNLGPDWMQKLKESREIPSPDD